MFVSCLRVQSSAGEKDLWGMRLRGSETNLSETGSQLSFVETHPYHPSFSQAFSSVRRTAGQGNPPASTMDSFQLRSHTGQSSSFAGYYDDDSASSESHESSQEKLITVMNRNRPSISGGIGRPPQHMQIHHLTAMSQRSHGSRPSSNPHQHPSGQGGAKPASSSAAPFGPPLVVVVPALVTTSMGAAGSVHTRPASNMISQPQRSRPLSSVLERSERLEPVSMSLVINEIGGEIKSVDDRRRTEDGEQTLMSSSSATALGKAVSRSSNKGPEGQISAKLQLSRAQELPKAAQQRPRTRSDSLFRIEHGLRVQDVPDAEFVSIRSHRNSVEDMRVLEESESPLPGAESQEAEKGDTSEQGKRSRPFCGCTIS